MKMNVVSVTATSTRRPSLKNNVIDLKILLTQTNHFIDNYVARLVHNSLNYFCYIAKKFISYSPLSHSLAYSPQLKHNLLFMLCIFNTYFTQALTFTQFEVKTSHEY